jgi:hypothetical protein
VERHAGGEWRFYLVPMPGLRNRVVVRFSDLQARPPNSAWPGYFTFGGGSAPVDLAEVREVEWRWEQPGPAKELRLGSLELLPDYVEHAARHPAVVGLHWFQWVDEPVTGRFDGENYNIGLVDVTDRPYDEMLAEIRPAHERLYALRRPEKVLPG